MLMVLVKAIEIVDTHQVEGSHFIIVWLISIYSQRKNELKHGLLRLRDNKMHSIS